MPGHTAWSLGNTYTSSTTCSTSHCWNPSGDVPVKRTLSWSPSRSMTRWSGRSTKSWTAGSKRTGGFSTSSGGRATQTCTTLEPRLSGSTWTNSWAPSMSITWTSPSQTPAPWQNASADSLQRNATTVPQRPHGGVVGGARREHRVGCPKGCSPSPMTTVPIPDSLRMAYGNIECSQQTRFHSTI